MIFKTVHNIMIILERLKKWIQEIPPLPSRSRFGNKAFCTYFDKVQEVSEKVTIANTVFRISPI